MSLNELREKVGAEVNRITKWRSLFAGWQLGTRPVGDPESDAVRDIRELLILLRVEVNALTGALMDRGLLTEELFLTTLLNEVKALDEAFMKRWPGAEATELGMSYDPRAMEWMKDFRP